MNTSKSQNRRFKMHPFLKLSSLLAVVTAVSACGVLSNPDRKETPSRLMLEAQAEYDAGNYAKASELLEKLIQKDTSNVAARSRLLYSYLGNAGISVLNIIKNKTSEGSSSGSGNITQMTKNSGLSDSKLTKIKESKNELTTMEQLRSKFTEFALFQKAFETICPAFPAETISKLKTLSTVAQNALNLGACGNGMSTTNNDITLAAVMLALVQISSLQPIFLSTEADGKTFTFQAQAKSYSDNISSLNTNDPSKAVENLNTLNSALSGLNSILAFAAGDIFNYTMAQVRIMSSVIASLNLPTDTKTAFSSLDTSLNTALSELGKYVNTGTAAASGGGTGGSNTSLKKTEEALTQAKSKATDYFSNNNVTADDKEKTCKNIYCGAVTSGVPTPSQYLPTGCQQTTYTCTTP